jgi:hypothetical protein
MIIVSDPESIGLCSNKEFLFLFPISVALYDLILVFVVPLLERCIPAYSALSLAIGFYERRFFCKGMPGLAGLLLQPVQTSFLILRSRHRLKMLRIAAFLYSA